MNRTWCYWNQDHVVGPVSESALWDLAVTGVLGPDSQIWPSDGGPSQLAVAVLDFSSLQSSPMLAAGAQGGTREMKGTLEETEQQHALADQVQSVTPSSPPAPVTGAIAPSASSTSDDAAPEKLQPTTASADPPVGTDPRPPVRMSKGSRKQPGIFDVGFRLGRYEVLAHIASGGMGQVYKALDVQLTRTVALKVLREESIRDDRDLERFRQEAQSAARLSHPHIVTLYDFGHDSVHNAYYLSLEFVDGIDLEDYTTRRGQLLPEEVRRILMAVTRALRHAFELGIVHRDIKPANIMLTRLGKKITVKLTDLGLARLPNAGILESLATAAPSAPSITLRRSKPATASRRIRAAISTRSAVPHSTCWQAGRPLNAAASRSASGITFQ
jgi:tRNA A-37 threonylcarbamoyl transferase component Bud32